MPNQSSSRAIVIVPTYNEVSNIEALIRLVWISSPHIDILVVDDASQDGTAEKVQALQKEPEGKRLSLLQRAGKLGLGTAYIAGFQWSLERGYQILIEMDADFSHDPRELSKMVEGLKRADVIVGSRYIRGGKTENWHPFRKFISLGGSLYSRMILGLSIRDLTGGFNAWRAEVLRRIDLPSVRSEGYSFQIELKYRAVKSGFNVREHPITFSERREGQSKMSVRIVLEAFYRVWGMRLQWMKVSRERLSPATISDKN